MDSLMPQAQQKVYSLKRKRSLYVVFVCMAREFQELTIPIQDKRIL